MKRDGKALSRRGLIKQLVIAVAVGPLVKLSATVAKAEKYRRNHAGAAPGEFWIGHC